MSTPTAIITHLNTHPFVQSLRSNTTNKTKTKNEEKPTLIESHGYPNFPPNLIPHHLTASLLTGAHRISTPPLVFSCPHGTQLFAFYHLGRDVSGYRGYVHGGLLAALLDEGLGWCCFPSLPGGEKGKRRLGATVRLEVEFVRPMRVQSFMVLRARTVRVEGRKAWVEGWIETLEDGWDGNGNGGGEVLVKGKAVYVGLRGDAML